MAVSGTEQELKAATQKTSSAAVLLIAQAVSLGFTLANLIIPGSAIFLAAYGSGRLPFVYLIVAGAGSIVSMAVNRLQVRFGLHHLAIGATLIVAGVAALSWRLIAGSGQLWAGYIVLTLFAVHLQMGFVFIGAQAGRAFDVQQIKRVFPRIVSGFVFGFMVGGFLADPLQSALDRSENLLAVATCGALLMAGLMGLTAKLTKTEAPEQDGADADGEPADVERPPPLRALFAIPLVSSVFAYQVLSAMGTQLVDYLVYDRAVARYSGAEELTSFMGSFTAILNLTGLIVLLLVGSAIMARYGLRFGVGANPVVVTGLLVLAIGASVTLGIGSTTLFVLVGIARISDITLADMATRTSVNATFQVLPQDQRLAAQVGVEGAGVPLALGLTAALILIINALFESPTVPVLVATMLVCIAWCRLSFVVFDRYRAGTVLAARRRMLDDVHVDLGEPATKAALVELAQSGSGRDVGAAIDLLAADDPSSVDGVLLAVAEREDIAVGHSVLGHLVARHPSVAVEVADRCVDSGQKRLVIDGLRALGRLGEVSADGHVASAVDHEDVDIRAAAIAARIVGEESAGRSVGQSVDGRESLGELVVSGSTRDRVLAALVIGELASTEETNQLLELVVDGDREVRSAAAASIGVLPDAAQNTIFQQLADVGDLRAISEFFRKCSGRAGAGTCQSVADWLSDAESSIVAKAVRFLAVSGYRSDPLDQTVRAIIDAQISLAESASRWTEELQGDDAVSDPEGLARLYRALAAERDQAQRHLIEALALSYDRDLMGRVGHLWSDRIDGDHAMAREALDLTLDEGHRSAVLRALADRQVPSAGETCSFAAVEALARDVDWAAEGDWLQACAVTVLDRRVDDLDPHGPITDEILAARR